MLRDLALFANGLAARYGGEVFLVGSALEREDPRDYDVRVVLDDEDYRRNFGDPDSEYEVRPDGTLDWSKAAWARAYAELKHSRQLGRRIGACIDVKFLRVSSRAQWLTGTAFKRIDLCPPGFLNAGKSG